MAKKLIDLNEAAKMLGVDPETLVEMRSRGAISGYRDGSSWKFKPEEIERLAAEQASAGGDESGEFAELDDDSLLLDPGRPGSASDAHSTVVGRTEELLPESSVNLSKSPTEGSSLKLTDSSIKLGGSEAKLISGSGALSGGITNKFDELDTLDLDLPSPSESGIKLGSSKKLAADAPTSGSDLSLDDDDLLIGSEPVAQSAAAPESSDIGVADSDDDLVLGAGSDITRSPSDSGINLMAPTDSGISLEAPLELSGGSGVESIDVADDEMLLLDEASDKGKKAAAVQADDDFLLTPLDEGAGEESDSGSQVIALDADVEFDDAAATMRSGPRAGSEAGLLVEDLGGTDLGTGVAAGAGALAAGGLAIPGAAGMAFPVRSSDGTYSLANILLLSGCAIMLTLCGMMTYDLMRNMWSWDAPYQVNSGMMNTIIGLFEKR